MARVSPASRFSTASSASLEWRPTKIMHMSDLSKDDDFLSHLLVEKLGTGTVPLLVHKMDSSRRLPKTDTKDLMNIVKRLVRSKLPLQQSVRQAVDELLTFSPIRYYLKSYTQKQINAFATHASRYFELYNPSGSIEIAHTSRYSHHTGKSELCILATRNLSPGTVVTELKGSMANLTDEEDKELKRTDIRNSDIRRDFSVIHSKSMKKNHLFLGPARFVNHDCDNNCELFREGRYITFRVIKPISIGEEITAHYGDGYFGKRNKHCLCETCEKNGKGGYSPDHKDDEPESSSDSDSGSDSDSDSDSDTSSSDAESDNAKKPVLNINERRTRRGVYAVTKPDESEESEEEDDDKLPLAHVKKIYDDTLTAEIDTGSALTSLSSSMTPSDGATPEKSALKSRSSSSLTELTPSTGRSSPPKSSQSTPFRSIISTRRQSARQAEASGSSLESSPKRLTRSISNLLLSEKKKTAKGKATATPSPMPASRSRSAGKEDPKIKKEETEARVLRVRQSGAVAEPPKEPSATPDIPRGPDGEPLPTCSTCSNVLPLISVNSKVVWGLGLEVGGKKKKNQKQECPRCIRHFAIYGQPWPSRSAPPGTLSGTPREDLPPPDVITKKVTDKGLSMLDRKLAQAASLFRSKGSKKHEREEDEEGPARPTKMRKFDNAHIKGKLIKTYSSSVRRSRRLPSPIEEAMKRKRGRPRLSSPKRFVKVVHAKPKVKVEEPTPEVEESIFSQPRAINGRFGRKGRMTKSDSNPRSTSGMEEADNSPRNKGNWTSPRRKRPSDDMEEPEESPRKMVPTPEPVVEERPMQRVLPRRVSGFRGGRLFSNPNPLQFALYAWAGPVQLDDSSSTTSSEDEKHPETPDDNQSSAADVASAEDEFFPRIIPRAPLTFKPSPFVFAKSRWNGSSSGHLADRRTFSSFSNIQIRHFDDESADVSPVDNMDNEGSVSSHSDSYGSPRSSEEHHLSTKLRHIYPVLPPAASSSYVPKSTTFPPVNLETKPSFINAGWDDASDISDT